MDIEKTFIAIGGVFLRTVSQIKSDLTAIEAFIFDWDGVFNSGIKTGDSGSPFSEVDSMGINLLRFSRWLNNKKIPLVFVITGENNPAALKLSQRESFNGIFLNCKDKKQALERIAEKYSIMYQNMAVVFDDVLDIEIAQLSGLSFCVGRKSTPLLENYIKTNGTCAYITGSSGDKNAVREVCELLMGIDEMYEKTIQKRIEFSSDYQQYLKERNRVEAEVTDYKSTL